MLIGRSLGRRDHSESREEQNVTRVKKSSLRVPRVAAAPQPAGRESGRKVASRLPPPGNLDGTCHQVLGTHEDPTGLGWKARAMATPTAGREAGKYNLGTERI